MGRQQHGMWRIGGAEDLADPTCDPPVAEAPGLHGARVDAIIEPRRVGRHHQFDEWLAGEQKTAAFVMKSHRQFAGDTGAKSSGKKK